MVTLETAGSMAGFDAAEGVPARHVEGRRGVEARRERRTRRDEAVSKFEAWYRAEHPRLVAALTVAFGSTDQAQEATAEAFARALAAWPRVGAMESPTGWTYRVAVNVIRRRGRRASMEARLLHRAALPMSAAAPDDDIALWHAVAELPPRERLAVALRYAGGLTEAEVASAMDVAVGTASATLASARKHLAAILTDDEEPSDA